MPRRVELRDGQGGARDERLSATRPDGVAPQPARSRRRAPSGLDRPAHPAPARRPLGPRASRSGSPRWSRCWASRSPRKADLLAAARPARHQPAARRARRSRSSARTPTLPESAGGDDPARRRRRGDRRHQDDRGRRTVRRNHLVDPAADRRHRRHGRRPVAAGDGRRHAGARPLPRRARPAATRSSCSAPSAAERLGIDRDRRARVARRALVHGDRDPRSGHARPVARQRRARRLRRRRAAARTPTARRRRSTCAPSPDAIDGVRDLLGRTANPEHPEEVEVSRPSDALEARAAAKTAFTVAVPRPRRRGAAGRRRRDRQRDGDLGARAPLGDRAARALGATRRHVGAQFLSESLLLAGRRRRSPASDLALRARRLRVLRHADRAGGLRDVAGGVHGLDVDQPVAR